MQNSFWHLLLLIRIVAFVLLRKMWADRCAGLLEIQSIHQNPTIHQQKPPPQQKLSPRNFTPTRDYPIGGQQLYPVGTRDDYLYQASLNA